MNEEINITVRSKGTTYTFTSPADIKRALDRQYREGYSEGYDRGEDAAEYYSSSDPYDPHQDVYDLIKHRIFQIENGTTHADKSAVEVLEELLEEI